MIVVKVMLNFVAGHFFRQMTKGYLKNNFYRLFSRMPMPSTHLSFTLVKVGYCQAVQMWMVISVDVLLDGLDVCPENCWHCKCGWEKPDEGQVDSVWPGPGRRKLRSRTQFYSVFFTTISTWVEPGGSSPHMTVSLFSFQKQWGQGPLRDQTP